jgi:hypothetical protein
MLDGFVLGAFSNISKTKASNWVCLTQGIRSPSLTHSRIALPFQKKIVKKMEVWCLPALCFSIYIHDLNALRLMRLTKSNIPNSAKNPIQIR